MKINRLKSRYNLVEEELKASIKSSLSVKNQHSEDNTRIPELSAEVIRLLASLNSIERDVLIKIWFEYNLPFNIKLLTKLLSIIKNTENEKENPHIIRAFAIIYKNKLPLLTNLIIGLSHCCNPDSSITEELNQLKEGNHLVQKDITSKLPIDISLPPEKLAKKTTDFTELLPKILRFIYKNPGKNIAELYNKLLGQQIINNYNDKLLLALEIPFSFPEYNKLYPTYLQIWKDDTKKKEKNTKKHLTIKFLIKLKKKELIQIDAHYTIRKNQPSSIKITFYCSTKLTKKIAEKKSPLLKESLTNLGLHVNNISFNLDRDVEKTKSRFHNLFEDQNSNQKTEFRHINFRI